MLAKLMHSAPVHLSFKARAGNWMRSKHCASPSAWNAMGFQGGCDNALAPQEWWSSYVVWQSCSIVQNHQRDKTACFHYSRPVRAPHQFGTLHLAERWDIQTPAAGAVRVG